MRLNKLLETNIRLLKNISQVNPKFYFKNTLNASNVVLNQKKYFSEDVSRKSKPFALFPNRDTYILPNPFKVLFQNLRLRWEMARVDSNFNLVDFYKGSQMALASVSNKIAVGDFNNLNEMVLPSFLDKIRGQYIRLTDEEKNKLAVKLTDIFSQNIIDFNINTNDSTGNIVVNIRMQFVLMNDADDIKKSFMSFYNLSFKDLLDKNISTITLADYG